MNAPEYIAACLKSNQAEVIVYQRTPTVPGPLSVLVHRYTPNDGRPRVSVVLVRRVPPGTKHGEMVYAKGAGLPLVAVHMPDIDLPFEGIDPLELDRVIGQFLSRQN